MRKKSKKCESLRRNGNIKWPQFSLPDSPELRSKPAPVKLVALASTTRTEVHVTHQGALQSSNFSFGGVIGATHEIKICSSGVNMQ